MKKSILITGISGTGKSTISDKLNQMGYKAYDMDSHPGLFSMIDKKTKKPVVDHNNEDIEKVVGMDWICDKTKLKSIIEDESNELAFYCGSASNLEEILRFFDTIILLKVDELVMRQRLTSRTENDFGKTSEIQDWIMTWKDWWENDMQQKGAIDVDTNKSIDVVVADIIKKVNL